jgi:O-antigen/teichoic acid export membrane protein
MLVLVRSLGVESFASWAIIEPLLLIFATLAALGMNYGLVFTTAAETEGSGDGLGTAILITLPAAVVVSIFAWIGINSAIATVGVFNLALPIVADSTAVLIVSRLRGQKNIGIWLRFETIRSLGLVAIAFVAFKLGSSWVSTLDQFLLLRGTFTSVAVIAAVFMLGIRLNFHMTIARRMMGYGLPITLSAVFSLVTSSADRFLLALFRLQPETIANYVAHQRLTGMLVVLVVTPLNLWFAVEAIRRDTAKEAAFFQGVASLLLGTLSLLMIAVFLAGPIFWPLLFPQLAFHPAIYALLCLSIVPQSLGIVLNIGGLREKKTHLNALVVLAAGATIVGAGLPLVHAFTSLGAALARFVSFVVQAVAGRLLSQSISPVRHRLTPLVPFIGAILVGTGCLLSVETGVPPWLFGIFSLMLSIFGFAVNWRTYGALFADRTQHGNDAEPTTGLKDASPRRD